MQSNASRPFFFIHIRKTAGVSLRGLLANRFPADKILLQAHSVYGPQEPGEARFATGHVDFDYAARFKISPTIFTMLREPIERCLSAYDFFHSHDEQFFGYIAAELSEADYQSRRRFQDRARSLGLLRFLVEEEELARPWLANVQTRQLAGASCSGLADDDPQLLETALDHLARIELAGIVERLEDSLRLLERTMLWGEFGPLLHLNRTARTHTSNVDPRCLEILRAWNGLDLRLYEEACRLFEAKVQAQDELPSGSASSGSAWPIAESRFTPDQPIYGYGWHEREHHGRWLCWNSAPRATLNLRLAKARPAQLRCLLSHVINEAALGNLEMALNAIPLMLRKRETEGGILIESDIPPQAWTEDPYLARLTIKCPDMAKPCDLSQDSTDDRSLGVAMTLISFD